MGATLQRCQSFKDAVPVCSGTWNPSAAFSTSTCSSEKVQLPYNRRLSTWSWKNTVQAKIFFAEYGHRFTIQRNFLKQFPEFLQDHERTTFFQHSKVMRRYPTTLYMTRISWNVSPLNLTNVFVMYLESCGHWLTKTMITWSPKTSTSNCTDAYSVR